MAYPNRASNGRFQNGGYQPNGNYNRGNSGGNYRQQKKHTGATTGTGKNGKRYTTGWNYSKRFGLVKFLCVETSTSVESKSATGRKWLSVMVKVSKPMSPEAITNGMMDVNTGQVTIQSMGLVINPKAKNGGYCGKYGGK